MFSNLIFVSLGSNIGDKLKHLDQAANSISADKCCKVEKVSSVYETIPYGYKDQDNFYNAAIKLRSSYTLKEFYELSKSIEKELGRNKRDRWGPREIDIDILFYNDLIYSDDLLTIPHKEILNRDFVLVPLCEIASEVRHPGINKRICEIKLDGIEKTIINKIPGKIEIKCE
ncbi:MAG: 2-amino-4-hydroxy-6-hydroxymethyldihydropteridine diphosphokinase [Bacteroidota bacterium]|nr:2-amino-4-hydroxy-6-hydroxymethyldihydropteridine diphosphokinase [Bacteroidota bacterium]